MKKTTFVIVAFAMLLGAWFAPALHADDPPFTVTTAITKRAVFSCTDFTFSDGVIDSLGISNNVVVNNGGDVGSNGNVKLSGGAVVYGNATAGPGKAVTSSGSSRVTGTKSVATAAEVCVPIDLTSLVPAVQASNNNNLIPLTGSGKNPMGGSSHTEFTLSGGDTITLPPGTYYFTKFTVSGGSTITLTGPTRFLSTGRVDISGGSFVNPQPYRFRIWVSGSGPFTLSGGSNLAGFVYAPSASATISSARLIGAVFANQVTVSGSAHISRAIDDIRPSVTITQPANGTVVSDPAHVLVKGTASDDEGPVTVQVNGQAATVNSDGTFQITLNLSGASPATITAVATDLNGNTNSAQVTVTTVPPPLLTLSSPAPGSWVNTRVVTLSGGSGNAVSVTVNGQPAVVSGGVWTLANYDLGADGARTLTITGTNSAGIGSTINPIVNLDTVAPTIQSSASPAANAAGWNNSDVTVSFTCADSGSGIVSPGNCPAAVTVTTEGTGLTVTRTAVDRAGNSTPITVTLNIDKTLPHPTFTSHTNNQIVASRTVTIVGGSDDAETVKVNGAPATVDAAAHTFTIEVSLLEGENTLTAQGVDRAGNIGAATLKLVLDSRAPEIAITAPASGACVKDNSVEIRGTVSEPNIDKIDVTLDGATTHAVLDATHRTWTANVALGADGRKSILAVASDTAGHTATRQLTLTADHTEPQIEITEGGAPFSATLVNRPVTLFFRATDADANTTITAKLNGTAIPSGTQISEEKTHTLVVTATDCAGNQSSETRTFAIDLTPPHFLTFNPTSGSKVSQIPTTLSGTIDADAVEVRIAGGSTAPVANGAFTLTNVGFADGVNELTLEAVDRAGNIGHASYTLGIKTTQPLVEITESGEAMVEGAVYNRAVAPAVRVFEEGVTSAATLDNAPFTSGATVSANGPHVITATATDSVYGQSSTVTRHFTIDRSAPKVTITSPANNAVFDADRVNVSATAEDAVTVVINGIPAVKNADASWTAANVPLEMGENPIVAVGRDSAGNTAHDAIVVTRNTPGPAIVLTFPPNPYITNRPHIDVTGRVLRPAAVAVTVPPASPVSAAVDPAGVFRVTGAELKEGQVTIKATVTDANGKSTSVEANVTADFTPPRVRLLESGNAFNDGANFPVQAALTADATDNGAAIPFTLTIDGNVVTSPQTVSATGGHTAVIVARDQAGNESRLERSFTVGSTAGGGCRLEGFDPADGSVVTAQHIELVGRSGGAAGVKANGIAAYMSNGSFCVRVELPQEGPNPVRVACTDAAGAETGTPVTITLNRITNDPSVTIDLPHEDDVTANETITVTGTLGNGAIAVAVNGTPATVNGSNWSTANVRLRDGVNILVARASTSGSRYATASRRVVRIPSAPAITISSPIPGYVTGTAKVDVSGTWSNVDPSSLAVAGLTGAVTPAVWSDTTGRFLARDVPLTSGDNTITVTGRDRTGRPASAQVVVKYTPGNPTINITDPYDNQYFPASAGATFRVSGNYTAAEGSGIDVGGTTATQDTAAKTFFADVPFSTLASGMTPVVARISEPGGAGAFDTIRVFKLAEAPKVLDTFPAKDAVSVDNGVVVLVLFSNPMDLASVTSAFRLESSNGTPVSGKLYLDKDVLTFAPLGYLSPGERYTIRVGTGAKDLAGQPLASEFTSSFTVSTTAPATAPTLTTANGRFCGQLIDVAGTSVPSAQVRIDYGTITFLTQASSTGAFSYKVPLSGQPGYHVIRVRTVGADGTLSPYVELKVNLDCTGPKVLSSSYDRSVNKLTVVFSTDVKASTLTAGTGGSVQLVKNDNSIAGGTFAVTGANAVITPAEDLTKATFTLKISTAVTDTQDRHLDFPYTNLFTYGDETPQPGDGSGYITGEVYDATTGRPLANADITIEAPVAAFSKKLTTNAAAQTQTVTMHTDGRGRYGDRFPEGAHTIKASANGYTTVWRQIVVPAGAGVIPIDIRLTRNGDTKTVTSGALTLSHGTTNAVVRHADLNIPAGAVASGATVTLTSTGAQSLAGLLPLGWSPLASAEIVSNASSLGASTLTFDVPQSDISANAQVLTAVRYDSSRDEWRVVTPAVNIASNKATFDVNLPGAYALVYPDRRAGLTTPPAPTAGGTLAGVADRCADGTCPAMVAKSFPLNPEVVLPTDSTVATLNIDGATAQLFPSGTAVQAYIEEELHLADGGRELGFPFATDLLLYRDLAGNTGVASFNLAPSTRAAEVFLEVGFEHLRILPYPGRLDRGTLIGPEGGRVPGDDKVAVEIPTGSTPEALRATASSLTNPDTLGPIAGYKIVGGFQLTLQRATSPAQVDSDGDGQLDPVAPVELTRPARATFTVDASKLPALSPSQLILVELIDQTPFGNRVFRLASEMTALDAARWTTKSIDRNVLPIDGVIHEGRYLLLAAEAPIGFAKGVVKVGDSGLATANARVTATGLGVADLTRTTGIFNVPVQATPAAGFTLVPRTVDLGDGNAYQKSPAPAPNEVVNVGDLVLLAQPPRIASTTPASNATNVAITTNVEVRFDPGLDPASVGASSLVLIDTTTGKPVAGTVSAVGNLSVLFKLPAGQTLQPGTRYLATVSPAVRGINGTPLGQGYAFSFTTLTTLTNGEIHPEKIRITLPDANGVSRVTGAAGAIPANWIAVAVRRGHDFTPPPSDTAKGDGSFSMTLSGVAIADEIDLRLLNTNGALSGIIPLTPFVAENGRAFVAPANKAVTFTSADGVTVAVPAGAFDHATLIEVTPAPAEVFNVVPNINNELAAAGSVTLTFEGRANVPLELTFPAPTASGQYFLGVLGQSVRGPRIMAVDTLYIVNGTLTTVKPPSGGARTLKPLTGLARNDDPKDFLLRVIEQGSYAAYQMKQGAATNGMVWSFIDTLTTIVDLFWDTMYSMYCGHRYVAEAKGRIAFPVPAGTRFTITGVDPATSLTAFQSTYDPIPLGDPGKGVVIANPDTDFNGPYPVFASPFRVEIAEVPPENVTLNAIRDLELKLNTGGTLTIQGSSSSSGSSSIDGTTKISALNVRTGERRGPQQLPINGILAKPGDRIILLIDEKEIDPAAPVSVVFNEAIDLGAGNPTTEKDVSDFLKTIIKFEQMPPSGSTAQPTDILKTALLRLDSTGRRVSILLPSSLAAGEKFRLTLEKDIKDRSGNNLGLGQAGEKDPVSGNLTPIGSAAPMETVFETRGPKGNISDFTLRQSATESTGSIRDMTSYGNLLFVAAVDGGILAYDMSDPAALSDTPPSPQPPVLPIAYAPGGVTQYWSVQADHHGRIYAAGMTNLWGVLRTYRAEDFVKANLATTPPCGTPHVVCNQIGATITSQNIGTSYGVGLGSALVTADRVDAIPRKVRVVVGDAPPVDYDRGTFIAGFGTNDACVDPAPPCDPTELHKFDAHIPAQGTSYRIQRITVENVSLGLKWSADARADGSGANLPDAQFKNIVAGPNDVLRVTYNLSTYAVVTLFGYGIGVFDMNAVESNDSPQAAGTVSADLPQEQVTLRANALDTPPVPGSTSINSLAYSPESAIQLTSAGTNKIYTLDAKKGAVDFVINPPSSINRSGEIVLTGGINSRFEALKAAVTALNQGAIVRFNTAAVYDNPDTKKSYLLMPALDYGLIVVEAGNVPLNSDSFADVVWIPAGAYAVRVIEGTNMAVVIDGQGHALLVDLARVDERIVNGTATTGLFPTAAAALAGSNSYGGYGADDIRILWRSEDPVGSGQVAPVVDPDTGFLFGGDFLARKVHVASAIDPKMRFMVNVGAKNGKLREVGSIVPLGVAPPDGVLQCDKATDPDCPASLGVFRVEANLPGSITDTLPSSGLEIAIESELVPGADTPQTVDPYPVAHLRYKRRDGNVDLRAQTPGFAMKHVLDIQSMPELRYQKGYNRFVTDWIVAIADPRASKDYSIWTSSTTNEQKENLGCFSCERPKYVKDDATAKELYTAGRFLVVRPEEIAAGNPYGWLSEDRRLRARAGTIMADTVRPANVLIAAQNPPLAGGILQESIYLHSGEVGHDAVDLDAGGRNGWDVVVSRAYRSRTLGFTSLGIGWDSGLLKRLRALPSGDVEYRDGSGEMFLFRRGGTEYSSPKGYFARLAKTDSGWVLTDQKLRVSYFDDYGRLVRQGDEFYTPDGKGNQTLYIYDSQGRLDSIVDANDRVTHLHYFEGAIQKEGFLKEVEDWRSPSRKLTYDYDSQGRLTNVFLPEFRALLGTLTKPERRYAYDTGFSASYSDKIELSTNLVSVIEPDRAPFSGPERVKFTYSGPRDYVKSQKWATGEEATFDFSNTAQPKVTDIFGQERRYTLKIPSAPGTNEKYKWYTQDRAHIATTDELAVDVYKDAASGSLPPAPLNVNSANVEQRTRTFNYGYDDDGLYETVTLTGASTTQYTYTSAGTNLGKLVQCVGVGPAGSFPCSGGGTVKTTYDYNGTYLQSTTANGQTVQSPEPHRGTPQTVATNSGVTTTTTYDLKTGLPKEITTSGGTAGDPTNSKVVVDYPATQPPDLFKRGLPEQLHVGTAALTTKFTYDTQSHDHVDDGRNTTETIYDEWHRPVKVTITNNAGDPLKIEETYEYDPAGRLHVHTQKQATAVGEETVATTYAYDFVGRTTEVKKDKIDVNGTPASVTETVNYSQVAAPMNTITTQRQGETEIVRKIDHLGRTKESKQEYESGKFIVNVTAYDLAGNTVYTSDQKDATASAFDPAGRVTATLKLDGTVQKLEYDGWGHVVDQKLVDAAGSEFYKKHTDYTPAGKVERVTESGNGLSRDITQQWDAAGRTVHIASTASGATDGGRATILQYDDAGRLQETRKGQGTVAAISQLYDRAVRSLYGATTLAKRIEQYEPKSGSPSKYQLDRDFDTVGNTKLLKIQALEWKGQYDQKGDVLKSSLPGRPTTEYEYDSRGNLIRETLPDGSVKHYEHNATGAKVRNLDEESEETKTGTDSIGRTTSVTYHDGTTEEYVYDGSRMQAMKNRQGMWQSFEYNTKGQLITVYASQFPTAGVPKLDEIAYNDAGQMQWFRTKDALIEYSDYTLDSLPKTTKQTRYKDGSGFSTATILDSYTINHQFNGYGELTQLTMPGNPTGGWTKQLNLSYDALGNLIELRRDGEVLLAGEYRNGGRPDSRTVTITPQGCATASCLKKLVRTYYYEPATAQLKGMVAKIGTLEVAGSTVKHDNTLQVTEEQLAGISGSTRYTRYSYDARGRLYGSVTAVSDATTPPVPSAPTAAMSAPPGVAEEVMSPADFRKSQERMPLLDTATRDDLKKKGVNPDTIDPPGSKAEPQPGHKINKFTKGPTAADFKWTKPDGTGDGDVRTEDGRFRYGYDEKHRLVWVAEKPLSTAFPIRRILYSYDANSRMVGRTAQYATIPTLTTPLDTLTWNTEDRSTIIAADGIPPELTFVWDAVTDRLLSVYKTGSSAAAPTDPDGNLIRQFIHGDFGLDDPIEITTVDYSSVVGPGAPQPLARLYPVFDEAGNGTLQVVINRNGDVVGRSISTDPYGAEQFTLAGAAVDQVSVSAKKDNAGNLQNVTVRMRATEALEISTVSAGSELSIVNAGGTPVLASPVAGAAAVSDPFSVEWVFTPAQWSSFLSAGAAGGGTQLSIGATKNLRAGAWAADVPVLPAPSWATATKNVFTSPNIPVEVRESLSNITAFITGAASGTESVTKPYEVTNLGFLGTTDGNSQFGLLMLANLHGQPFTDPFSGKNYVRARWFDPETGTWLTPDPLGYRDSSSLYTFAGGDPVNHRDPSGEGDDDLFRDCIDRKTGKTHGWFICLFIFDDNDKQLWKDAAKETASMQATDIKEAATWEYKPIALARSAWALYRDYRRKRFGVDTALNIAALVIHFRPLRALSKETKVASDLEQKFAQTEQELADLEQKAQRIKSPEDAWELTDKFREKAKGFEPLGDTVPVRGDGLGTVAVVEAGGKAYFGVNSSALADESKDLGRAVFKMMQDEGLLSKATQYGQGSSQVLTHAEAHALMRAWLGSGGKLGEEVTLYVDRATCANCRTYLGELMEMMNIKKLTIIAKGHAPTTIP